MADAAAITSALCLDEITFLIGCQMLANYFNGSYLSCPPHWEVRPFTQRFLNYIAGRRFQVFKIPRSMDSIAHSLANMASSLSKINCNSVNITCTNADRVNSYPV